MSRLSRKDWLKSGLQALIEEGINAIKVEPMCKRLEVTKGSFYHHFQNRTAYLKAIPTYWEERYTEMYIEESEEENTPKERLYHLLELVARTSGPQEVRLRAWAKTSPLASEYIERVDQKRIAYLCSLTAHFCEEEEEAMGYARLLYTALLGSAELLPPLKPAELQHLFDILFEQITKETA